MRFVYALLLGGCLNLLPAAGAAAPNFPVEPVMSPSNVPHTTRLSNGLTVMVLEDARFPLVSTRLYVHAGSAYETPDEAGISHVLEHMVFKGTERRPRGEVARQVEEAGGYLNAATSFDYTVYLTDMPARHWKLGMDVVRDMAFHPRLDPAELEAEKDVIVAEIERGKDSPGSLLFEGAQTACLTGTPYASPIIGFERTVRGLTVETIRAYIRAQYQPQSMLLVVVGDVRAPAVLAEAESLFGSYANQGAVSSPRPLDAAALRPRENRAAQTDHRLALASGPWNKVYLSLAVPVPGSNDVRATRLDVLAQLLGGDETSLLWRRYKYERGLVDTIRAVNLSFERVGMLYISAELAADKVAPFWEALTADLAGLTAESFTDEDIARAGLNLEDDLFRAKETLSGLASKLGSFQFLNGDGVMGERNVLETLRAVDRAQIRECLAAWLRPERLSAVMLVPDTGQDLPDARDLTAVLERNWPAAPEAAASRAACGESGAERIDLGEGRTLVLIPDASLPYVSAELAFSGGDSLLRPDQQGLAALTARILTRGTGKRDAMALQAWLGDRAADLAASSGRQDFSLLLTAPAGFAGELFALLNETVREPAFAASEVEREKQGQIALIRSRDDQPLSYAFSRLPVFLFPGSVFGYSHLGREQDIAAYTPRDARAFWDTQRARPWVLSVAGQFDREAMIAAAGILPSPEGRTARAPAPDWNRQRTLDLRLPGRQQAHSLLLFRTVPMDHPDAPGLELLRNILAGQSGLLFRDLRDDKGLGYSVTAFNSNNPEFGYLALYIGTSPDKLPEAQAGFERVLARLHDEALPGEAIIRGKNQMEGDYYRERQSLGSRAGEAASLALIGKPLSFRRDQIAQASTLDAPTLQRLARTYLNAAEAYAVRVLP